MKVILLADEESFEELLELRMPVHEALAEAGMEVSAVGVLGDDD